MIHVQALVQRALSGGCPRQVETVVCAALCQACLPYFAYRPQHILHVSYYLSVGTTGLCQRNAPANCLARVAKTHVS